VACQLKARIMKPLLWNGSANTPVARQWLSSRHVMAKTNTHVTTIEELLVAVLSVPSVSRLHIEGHLPLLESRERVCRQSV
jgi:hypothetical protein